MRKIKNTPTDNKQPISLKLELRSVNRKEKDVGKMRRAQENAERIYLPNRTELYDIYDDILLDLHLSGIIGKRFDAVLNKTICFRKEGQSEDNAKALKKLVESEAFGNVMLQVLERKLWGLSGMQFLIGKAFKFDEIPRKHIKPDLGIISVEQSGSTGFDYVHDPMIWVLGDRNDYGLLLKCAAYVIWKRGNWADWAQFIEIFGMPVRIMKYNMFDPQSKIEARKALEESGSALELLVPEGVEYEMKDGKEAGANGALQDTFRKAINEELSVCILGNTETTNSGKNSGYAISKEHSKQQFEVTKSDMVYLLHQLNSPEFITILKSYGYDVEGGEFAFEKEIDMLAVKEHMAIIQQAKGMGVPVDDDYIYEITGIPKPKDYDTLKKQTTMQQQTKLQKEKEENTDDPENKHSSPGERSMLKRLLNGIAGFSQ